MKPTQKEFLMYAEYDLNAQKSTGMRPDKNLLSLAKERIKSLVRDDGASLEFIMHYLRFSGNDTAAIRALQSAIDSTPPDYSQAWEILQSMHPNEVGASIGLLLNLSDQDLG